MPMCDLWFKIILNNYSSLCILLSTIQYSCAVDAAQCFPDFMNVLHALDISNPNATHHTTHLIGKAICVCMRYRFLLLHIEPTSKGGSKSERTRRRAERKARLPPATNRCSLRDAKSLANKIQSC